MSEAASEVKVETVAPQAAPETKTATETSESEQIAEALAAVEAEGPPEGKKEAEPKAAKEGEEKPDESKGAAAKGWAAIRRVEQKIARQKKELEAKEQAANERLQQAEERQRKYEQSLRELDENPVEYFSKKGVTFDDLAKRYLGDGKPTPEELARRQATTVEQTVREQAAQIAEMKAMLERREIETHINAYRGDIKGALASDDLELLRAWPDAEAEVYQFANNWAERHKEVLTPRDAALKLQSELRKQLTNLSSHQAVRSLLTGAGNSTQTKQAVPGQSQVPSKAGVSPKTLTNNFAATPATGEPDFASLSEEEQIQAALRLVQDA